MKIGAVGLNNSINLSSKNSDYKYYNKETAFRGGFEDKRGQRGVEIIDNRDSSILLRVGQAAVPKLEKQAGQYLNDAGKILENAQNYNFLSAGDDSDCKGKVRDIYKEALDLLFIPMIFDIFDSTRGKDESETGYSAEEKQRLADIEEPDEMMEFLLKEGRGKVLTTDDGKAGMYKLNARLEGDLFEVTRNLTADRSKGEVLFYTTKGELKKFQICSYSPLWPQKRRVANVEYSYDPDDNYKTLQSFAKQVRRKDGTKNADIVYTFKDGELTSVEKGLYADKKTGTKDVKELFLYKNGKISKVYIHILTSPEGKPVCSRLYEADKHGKLRCVYNRGF